MTLIHVSRWRASITMGDREMITCRAESACPCKRESDENGQCVDSAVRHARTDTRQSSVYKKRWREKNRDWHGALGRLFYALVRRGMLRFRSGNLKSGSSIIGHRRETTSRCTAHVCTMTGFLSSFSRRTTVQCRVAERVFPYFLSWLSHA